MKKLILSTLVLLTIGAANVSAGERMTEDNKIEIHKECFMHPVIVGTDLKENPYTKELYEINAYYDAVTGYRINTEVETIYMDDDNNRWYFPYDDDKYHKHDYIRMVFEKDYDRGDK